MRALAIRFLKAAAKGAAAVWMAGGLMGLYDQPIETERVQWIVIICGGALGMIIEAGTERAEAPTLVETTLDVEKP